MSGKKKIATPKVTKGPSSAAPYEIGNAYLFRTVTHHQLGRVVAVGPQEITIVEAGWLADSGRFHDFLKSGNPNEFEPAEKPADEIFVGRAAIVDVWPWHKDLPKSQK